MFLREEKYLACKDDTDGNTKYATASGWVYDINLAKRYTRETAKRLARAAGGYVIPINVIKE